MNTEAGASAETEREAAQANDGVTEALEALPTSLREWISSQYPTPDARYAVPPEDDWADDCDFYSDRAEAACTSLTPTKQMKSDAEAFLATVDDAYADEVNIGRTCGGFADLLGVAWTFLVRNTDILQWATCLIFGPGYDRRIVNKLVQDWFGELRTDIECDDGAGTHGVLTPCTPASCTQAEITAGTCESNLAMSFAAFGINICTATSKVETWIRLYRSGSWQEQLCAVVDVAAVLAHEMTHVTLTFRSGDLRATNEGNLESACARSHLLESIFRWAIYQRYPQALDAGCCSALVFRASDGSWDYNSVFMNANPSSVPGRCHVAGP